MNGQEQAALVALGRAKVQDYERENARIHKTIEAVKLAAAICALGDAAEALGMGGQAYLELIHQEPLVTLKEPGELEA